MFKVGDRVRFNDSFADRKTYTVIGIELCDQIASCPNKTCTGEIRLNGKEAACLSSSGRFMIYKIQTRFDDIKKRLTSKR